MEAEKAEGERADKALGQGHDDAAVDGGDDDILDLPGQPFPVRLGERHILAYPLEELGTVPQEEKEGEGHQDKMERGARGVAQPPRQVFDQCLPHVREGLHCRRLKLVLADVEERKQPVR